jgi:hypothetical protein
MDKKKVQKMYRDYLKEEGFKYKIDTDGNIIFWEEDEDEGWGICLQNAAVFFDLFRVGLWEYKDEAEHEKSLKVINEVNTVFNLVKISVEPEGDIVKVHAGFFIHNAEDFKGFFNLGFDLIQKALDAFVEGMQKE